MGTPDFAVESLNALLESGHNILAVVTATDKLGGRGGKQLIQSDVKRFAVEKGLNILQPEKLKSKAFIQTLKDLNADIFVVVAFRMLPEVVWSMPKHGTINVHGSLLPKYRGAAPINWAIINGEIKTGVTTFKLSHEIDTGAILDQKEIDIDYNDNFGTLYAKMKVLGAKLLIETLDNIEQNNIQPKVQDESEVCHAPKIFLETCQIDFNKKAEEVRNFIRGLSPVPCAYFTLDGHITKIFDADVVNDVHILDPGSITTDHKKYLHIACKQGSISIKELKMEGKKQMKIGDFLNGYKLA